MARWVEYSAVIAAVAGLWGLAIAWLTYILMLKERKHTTFDAIQSICRGLRSELEFMKFWSGSYSSGYSKNLKIEDADESWSLPSRIIWKFPFDTIRALPQSPYAYHLRDLIGPFLRLCFSISKFLQFYGEYREYVLSRPALYHQMRVKRITLAKGYLTREQEEYVRIVRDFNYQIHVGTIGGEDSDDEDCLYKTHKKAFEALTSFERKQKQPTLPRTLWLGHFVFAAGFLAGLFLLVRLFYP